MEKQQRRLMYPTLNPNNFNFKMFAGLQSAFSDDECEKIIEIGNNLKGEQALLEDGVIAKNYRDSEISWIINSNENVWIFEKLRQIIIDINEKYFGFELYGFYEPIQFTKYQAPSGKYDKHVDILHQDFVRKLSITVQLSDPNDYEGGDLLIHNSSRPIFTNKIRGTITAFPSFVLHEVTPVTKGTRYSLVAWVAGPAFR